MWSKIKGVLGKLKTGAGKAGSFVLRHGPWVSSLAMGASIVFPAAAPALQAVTAILSGVGSPADPELAKLLGEFLGSLLLTIGGARKVWALTKPKAV